MTMRIVHRRAPPIGWLSHVQPSPRATSGSGSAQRRREGLEVLGHGRGEQAARLEVARRAAQEAPAAGRSAEQLDGLHGREDEREAPPEVEVARVSLHDADPADPLARALSSRSRTGVAVQGDDLEPLAREVERDAPGARAHVEHRAALAPGEPAPQRQVGAVAAALEVVPQHVGRSSPLTPDRAGSSGVRIRRHEHADGAGSARTVAGRRAIGSPSA